jgi:hypothetical protein
MSDRLRKLFQEHSSLHQKCDPEPCRELRYQFQGILSNGHAHRQTVGWPMQSGRAADESTNSRYVDFGTKLASVERYL